MASINFTAPPTCAAFMKSQAFFRLIGGPVGSGKTTACLFEIFRRACEQAPGPDGLRHTRFAILRQTLSQLKMTVLKDITTWLEGIATFKVSENTIYIEVGDVRSEWVLIPLEDVEDQRRLLSSQLTGAWLSECIEIDVGLVPAIAGRCGRYPSKVQGGPTWFGIIADTNMPTIGSSWWKLMSQDVPVDWQVFIQPGGLDDDAENIDNLPGGREYYERLARSNGDDWVKRYVHALYGADPSGSAVYKESFKHSFHVADEVMPVNGHPLIIGQDFGRNPCSIITQLDHRGRLLVLEEVLAEDIGLELHIQRNLRPRLSQERYLGRAFVIVGDPAGKQRSTSYEETSFDLLKREGFMCYPAPTNNIDARLRAVETFLLAQRDGGPAMIFDKQRCPSVIMGMNGGYRFAKTRSGQLRPVPDKNEYSHMADALQYAASAASNGMVGMISGKLSGGKRRSDRPKVSSLAWT